VVDDYGHHPTEIAAVIAAARAGLDRRVLVVFQPHRYSRTRALLEEFGRAFALADRVIVTEIYAAGEPALNGVDGRSVADAISRYGHRDVTFAPRLADVPELVRASVQPGDLVLTLGAGDVWKVGDALLAEAALATPRRRKGAL